MTTEAGLPGHRRGPIGAPAGNGSGGYGQAYGAKVSTATPGKHEDGDGLRLVVSQTGARKWVLRVTTQGKRRELGLGTFLTVTLAEARTKAAEARKVAVQDGDPIATRKAKLRTFAPAYFLRFLKRL